MLNRVQKSDRLLFSLAVIGLAAFLFLYPRLFPEAAFKSQIPKEDVLDMGVKFIRELGFNLKSFEPAIQLKHNEDQLRYLNRNFGTVQTNAVLSDSIPIYFWTIQWTLQSDSASSMTVRLGREHDRDNDESNTITLLLDQRARPIKFESDPARSRPFRRPPEVDSIRPLGEGEALRLAAVFLAQDVTMWSFNQGVVETAVEDKFQKYIGIRSQQIAGERVSVEMRVQDGQVWSYQKVFTIPKALNPNRKSNIIGEVGIIFLFLLFIVLGVAYFITRLRSDLLDLKSGLIPALLVGVGWTISYWVGGSVEVSRISFLAALIGYVIITPFYAGAIWALFSVGESITREVLPQKLSVVDTLRRKLLFPGIGLAIFRGVALAFLGLGVLSGLSYLSVRFFNGYFAVGDTALDFWSSSWPSPYIFGSSLMRSLYIVVMFCLFLFGVIKRRFKNIVFGIFGVVLLWSLSTFPLSQIQPFGLRMVVNGALGLLFILFYMKYDIFAVAAGSVSLPIIFYGIVAIESGNEFFAAHGLVLLGFIVLLLFYAVAAFRSEEPTGEIVPYTPDYLQRIYEREDTERAGNCPECADHFSPQSDT